MVAQKNKHANHIESTSDRFRTTEMRTKRLEFKKKYKRRIELKSIIFQFNSEISSTDIVLHVSLAKFDALIVYE